MGSHQLTDAPSATHHLYQASWACPASGRGFKDTSCSARSLLEKILETLTKGDLHDRKSSQEVQKKKSQSGEFHFPSGRWKRRPRGQICSLDILTGEQDIVGNLLPGQEWRSGPRPHAGSSLLAPALCASPGPVEVAGRGPFLSAQPLSPTAPMTP